MAAGKRAEFGGAVAFGAVPCPCEVGKPHVGNKKSEFELCSHLRSLARSLCVV